ncbi:MAG: hypothetical protein RL757_2686 [Bacteroidota bacterium]|jgi:hypothetical protein
MMRFFLLIFLFLAIESATLGQQKKVDNSRPDTIVFRDTIHFVVADSFAHDFGNVPPINQRLTKYLKYIGHDTIIIVRAWTGDPHFICDYPRTPLTHGTVFPITFCFYFQSRSHLFRKVMGINLSNGNVISFKFQGNIEEKAVSKE